MTKKYRVRGFNVALRVYVEKFVLGGMTVQDFLGSFHTACSLLGSLGLTDLCVGTNPHGVYVTGTIFTKTLDENLLLVSKLETLGFTASKDA